jgi:hypothetical protein
MSLGAGRDASVIRQWGAVVFLRNKRCVDEGAAWNLGELENSSRLQTMVTICETLWHRGRHNVVARELCTIKFGAPFIISQQKGQQHRMLLKTGILCRGDRSVFRDN